MDRALVVGASLAGISAVEALREHGYDRRIALIGAESVLPYDRPPLSKQALRYGIVAEALLLRPPQWYEQMGVELHLGKPAVRLDVANRELVLAGGTSMPYDGVVIATGSQVRTMPTPADAANAGSETDGAIRSLRTIDDAITLRAELMGARSLVVVGAGFIGLEVAATAREMGIGVAIVELAAVPLTRVLGPDVGSWFRDHHERHGIEFHLSAAIAEIESAPGESKVRLANGTVLSADLIVAGIGTTPATDWLAGSGLAVDDGVRCDETLSAGPPGVVAAGDAAHWYHPLFGESIRVEQWSNAIAHGRHAAATLLGHVEACTSVPYFWSDQLDAKVRFVGRSNRASDIRVVERDDQRLVVLFGRDGRIRGALCVNAPRQLAGYRTAIEDQVAWSDVR